MFLLFVFHVDLVWETKCILSKIYLGRFILWESLKESSLTSFILKHSQYSTVSCALIQKRQISCSPNTTKSADRRWVNGPIVSDSSIAAIFSYVSGYRDNFSSQHYARSSSAAISLDTEMNVTTRCLEEKRFGRSPFRFWVSQRLELLFGGSSYSTITESKKRIWIIEVHWNRK